MVFSWLCCGRFGLQNGVRVEGGNVVTRSLALQISSFSSHLLQVGIDAKPQAPR